MELSLFLNDRCCVWESSPEDCRETSGQDGLHLPSQSAIHQQRGQYSAFSVASHLKCLGKAAYAV